MTTDSTTVNSLSASVALRPVQPEDESFLIAVYGSTRQQELAMVPWTAQQHETFIRFQYASQLQHYQAEYPRAEYSVVLRAACRADVCGSSRKGGSHSGHHAAPGASLTRHQHAVDSPPDGRSGVDRTARQHSPGFLQPIAQFVSATGFQIRRNE